MLFSIRAGQKVLILKEYSDDILDFSRFLMEPGRSSVLITIQRWLIADSDVQFMTNIKRTKYHKRRQEMTRRTIIQVATEMSKYIGTRQDEIV